MQTLRKLIDCFPDVVQQCKTRYKVETGEYLAKHAKLWGRQGEAQYIKKVLADTLQKDYLDIKTYYDIEPNCYLGKDLGTIFIDGLPVEQDIERPIQSICLILSQSCPNHCEYCLYPKDEPLTPHNQIMEVLQYITHVDSIVEVTISGGEPTIYPFIQDYIDLLQRANKEVKVLTSNWSDCLYADQIRLHLLHKYTEDGWWETPDGSMYRPEDMVQLLNNHIHLAGVATPENIKPLAWLDEQTDYMFSEFLTVYIQNDRQGNYTIPENAWKHLHHRHFTRELASYLSNTLLARHINYHIGKDEVYYSSDDRQKVDL